LKNSIKKIDFAEVIGEASNGVEAIRLYEELYPDIVFMDLFMPKMDGIDAIEEILKINGNAIIIVMSATEEFNIIENVIDKGAGSVIHKPFKQNQIVSVLNKFKSNIMNKRKEYQMSDEKIKVLVVDDARLARMILKSYINKFKFAEVIGEASNGVEAIELYKKLKPDLVTMDLDMPIMDGSIAIEQILKIDKYAQIIVVSAMEQEIMVENAKKKGVKEFIKKPVNQENLSKLLSRLF